MFSMLLWVENSKLIHYNVENIENEKCSADYISYLIDLLVSTISNLLNASATIFLEPCMYMSSGLYSSRISLYHMILSVLNVL